MLNPRIGVLTWCVLPGLELTWSAGSALTFSQMVFITVQSIPLFLVLPRNTQGKATSWIPRLKPRQVPLAEWVLQVFVLTSGTLLNNWAFAFNVPLAVMIVFRSAGES
jgi:solute carrier family 35 (UDP-xylose/UDP-N-acetylglucosamine transporter), member B4